MHIVDALLSVVAPHDCLGCGWEGSLLCRVCTTEYLLPAQTACFRCQCKTFRGLLCVSCRPCTALDGLQARTMHTGTAKALVHQLKFERAMAAAKPMARAMSEMLPDGLRNVMVVPVPTATSRVRQRGYDQAALLARQIAKQHKLKYRRLLSRLTQTRQVGATRQQRQQQLADAFHVSQSPKYVGMTVLLIDDVLTTGSTLETAARALKAAGAAHVYGLVFARQE